MINVSQSTQENNLIKLSKEIETKTNRIKEYLNTKNFSKCLSDVSELILLLKIDTLSPSNYFILYSELYDILQETI